VEQGRAAGERRVGDRDVAAQMCTVPCTSTEPASVTCSVPVTSKRLGGERHGVDIGASASRRERLRPVERRRVVRVSATVYEPFAVLIATWMPEPLASKPPKPVKAIDGRSPVSAIHLRESLTLEAA